MASLQKNTMYLQTLLANLQTKARNEKAHILYGTYLLKENPNYLGVPITVSQRFSKDYYDKWRAFGYWSYEQNTNYEYHMPIHSIVFENNCIRIIDDDGDYSLYYDISTQEWKAENDDGDLLNIAFDSYRILEFDEPFEVTKEFYDLFMSIIDNIDMSPYDIGRNIGYEEGKASVKNKINGTWNTSKISSANNLEITLRNIEFVSHGETYKYLNIGRTNIQGTVYSCMFYGNSVVESKRVWDAKNGWTNSNYASVSFIDGADIGTDSFKNIVSYYLTLTSQ